VNSLLAKIQANAAKRLPPPSGRKPSEDLARYKGFLKEESARLKILHRGGADGLEICHGRAAFMDTLIGHIWNSVMAAYPSGQKSLKITLVAFGGYGRGELCPQSDVDLMFLHNGVKNGEELSKGPVGEWSSALLYTLWDLGLKVGHAVRNVQDCIKLANSDMQSKTALLEARRICGDEALFAQLQAQFLAKCVKGHENEYIQQRLADQLARRTKHGNSPAMQEPNIKNGVGGLRDFQNLLWMIFFKLGIRTLPELREIGQINLAEEKQLEAAYDYLLRARTELHYVANRPLDVLAANVKPAVALGLGYSERSARVRVERFMHDYYTHARNVHLITRTLEQRLALVEHAPKGLNRFTARIRKKPAQAQIIDGFEIRDSQLVAASKNIFKEDPLRLIRAFLYSQQRGLTLHPDLAQLIRQSVASGLVNRSFMSSAHVRNTLLEILNARGSVAATVRAMHEVEFLGKLIPEFGKMTNLVQHEFYHQYAVDEHTLVCLEKADKIWNATEPPFQRYSEIFHELERPYLLYLALLLHDSGKAIPGERHEVVGGDLAQKAGNRLHLDPANITTLRRIIELHLAMVQVSQRRDLEDPAVILQFASQIRDLEHLDLLTLHTFADSMGTSDTLWNGFKDSLLWQLHTRTRELIQGNSQFIEAERQLREKLFDDVRSGVPKTFATDELEAHFTGMPPRYFQVHGAREIIRDLMLTHRFMHLQLNQEEINALEPVMVWRDAPDRGYTNLHICTWDRAGLFSKLTGALAAAGLTILAAQIYTRKDGVVLDEFFVADARSGQLPDPALRTRTEKLVLEILGAGLDPAKALSRAPRYPARYQSVGNESMALNIRFDNDTSETQTVIDLEAEDRVGLLFALSSTLYELRVDIVLAKIATERGAAIDTFYVVERGGGKIVNPSRLKEIKNQLAAAILETPGK
jgi:[protein-PII] uridylyltransferase